MQATCNSCKKRITNQAGTVTFTCPGCGGYELVRCPHCRVTGVRYTCPGCNFEGPN
jgi:predicted RNA-binding Zn-ribbon protein involved in translation (DUF1610 family)